MKNRFFKIGFWVITSFIGLQALWAAQPPAEQLLPAETILMFTVKDFDQATNNFWQSSVGRLWNDDVMRPTRDKFNARWTNEITSPLEKEFKVKPADYLEVIRGQVTFALTRPLEEGKTPGFLLLIDSKDKAELLKTRLADLQKKWTEGDRKLKTDKVRDVEFTTYQFTHAALQEFARTATGKGGEAVRDPEAETNKISLMVGQSQSLLVIGTQTRDLEKVLARQGGAGATALSEQPVFQSNFNSMFRDASMFGWLDFKPVFDQLMKPSGPAAAAAQSKGMDLRVQKVLPALGLGELKSIALRVSMGAQGYESSIFLTAPEATRQGLLKILAPPAKDASPPSFVPADAVRFRRLRIDFQQAWAGVETILQKIDPSVAGVVQLMINAAGKDKDPDFDLKKSLIESVGDDFISYEKPTKNGPPASISLIGARNSEQLLSGIRALMRMLPEPIGGAPLKEREFLGHKIYSVSLTPPGLPVQPGSEVLLSTTPNIVAIARDSAILEEYLRSGEAPPKPLRDLPGFNEAAQKVGGMNTGWFSFENQLETMRAAIEEAKKNPDKEPEDSNLGLNVLGGRASMVADWVDYNSLPPFERIAKYFYYSLLSASSTPEGISFRLALPAPPGLK